MKLKYSSSQQATSFIKPSIQFYPNQQNQDPWILHAQNGVLLHGTKTLEFHDNVILISPKNKTKASELLTDSITINYDQMVANSNGSVVIKNDHLVLSGKGFYANLKKAYIKISSKIKGQYQIDKE